MLVKLPSNLDNLSIKQFYDRYGNPEAIPVTERNGKPLPPNVPEKAVLPLYLGKDAEEFSLSDAQVLLSDLGESFSLQDARRGEDCHTPLAMRPPEAQFEPQSRLSCAADIWSLAVAIWEMIGMKALFSNDFMTADEMVAQHIDVPGPMPLSWWNSWEERSQFFDENVRPIESRQMDVDFPIEEAFEEYVQKYRRKSEKVRAFGEEETAAILDLMRRMLAFRPEERPTVEEVLKSEWMVKCVLPDFNRTLEK